LNTKFKYLIFWLFLFKIAAYSQTSFRFVSKAKKQTISFKLISNLIVIPIEVNGIKLNFILDSGVGTTILFNIHKKDSVKLRNVKSVKLKGLGSEQPVDAILSTNNIFKIKDVVSGNQKLYVVFNDFFDLSSKLGITIHGIIGYNLLKDFLIKINYGTKKITFYNPANNTFKGCRKCTPFNLEFYKLKPYINAGVKLKANNSKISKVKLLIDSGGSDAMWLFENTHPDIKPPTNYFDDYLGEGLSGSILGKRSKIEALVLGNYVLKNPTVSFPDSISIVHALQFKERNGSLGASILKRFTVYFDYKNSKLYLKKNSAFKDPFRYNMSGIELAYNGKLLVKESKNISTYFENKTTSQSKFITEHSYKYTFKPSYIIHRVNKGSPAFEVGILPGDILIKIDDKFSFNSKLEEIVQKFYQKEGTIIRVMVERYGRNYFFQFKLKSRLK
jgi:hypothetical protein